MAYLYSIFDNPFAKKVLANVDVPDSITDNLRYEIRSYQDEAFKRYIYLDTEDLDEKPSKPYHLLFNMATGSGKTLVMAGLILYLFEKGYRNFLFFVNSNNIIKKTKDNFLNAEASKYLFSEQITVDGKEIFLKEVENFDEADNENINIKFTTIQQLHIDLNNTKENSVTYEDFIDRKLVLIADEAHHLSSATRSGGDLYGSWEGTVVEVLEQNLNNILLEFTATLDYESREIVNKYQSKVIYKYDLGEFRQDKYSKEIDLIRSEYDEKQRIIQALILNLYREELATSNNINLKPVILFKAKRTIAESELNKTNFHKIIDELSDEQIGKIRQTSTVPVVQKAFAFFDRQKISESEVSARIKSNFREENCISANNDAEAEQNQIKLNTLEDENNPIRAVFALQKLNEGWDVLNLFDIVRLYEGRDGKENKPGKTTISEAQLIGRGARYFPFTLEAGQDKYTRKFDDDPANDFRILEELFYHTKEDSKYISELKIALRATGMLPDKDLVPKRLILKDEFRETDFYKNGWVVFNVRKEKSYDNVKSISDLGVSKRNFSFKLSSGIGRQTIAFEDREEKSIGSKKSKDIKLSEIPKHIIRYAISQNPYFLFGNLEKYFPNLGSISNFLESKDYLGDLAITFTGEESRFDKITNADYLVAVQGLLQNIESEIKSNLVEYESSDFDRYEYVRNIFKDKDINIPEGDERLNGQEDLIGDKNWYVYNANYGTTEEKKFVELLDRKFESLNQKFENIYLIRNERELKIYNKEGRAFEPDFLLFCNPKNYEHIIYQIFIEPKGEYLAAGEKWKNEFLKELQSGKSTLTIDTDMYQITAVPFYNYNNENEFVGNLRNTLDDY